MKITYLSDLRFIITASDALTGEHLFEGPACEIAQENAEDDATIEAIWLTHYKPFEPAFIPTHAGGVLLSRRGVC